MKQKNKERLRVLLVVVVTILLLWAFDFYSDTIYEKTKTPYRNIQRTLI